MTTADDSNNGESRTFMMLARPTIIELVRHPNYASANPRELYDFLISQCWNVDDFIKEYEQVYPKNVFWLAWTRPGLINLDHPGGVLASTR